MQNYVVAESGGAILIPAAAALPAARRQQLCVVAESGPALASLGLLFCTAP
jgi:hypothetical protein